MRSYFLFAITIFLAFNVIAQKNNAPNYKAIDVKEKRTFVLGLDSVLDDRAKEAFVDNWKISHVAIRANKSDMKLLADTTNLIVSRAKMRDDSGDLKSALILVFGGIDTTKVKMRKDGYLEIQPSDRILAKVWVNSNNLDSYAGILYFQALYSDFRMRSTTPDLTQIEKKWIKTMRRNRVTAVHVRASQLENNINSPSGVSDLSDSLAQLWKKEVVEVKLRNRQIDEAFVDVVSVKLGKSYSKVVYVMGVQGMIYSKSYPTDIPSNKLNKTEFRDLMKIINDNQKKD